MTDLILDDLNPQQLEAVTAPEGPVLVVAGAGSGKTRVITRRIAYLVNRCGVAPGEIFAATFTNKAADEMKRRVSELLGSIPPHYFAIATFHSLCARLLRREAATFGLPSNFTICDESDQLRAVRHVMKEQAIDSKTVGHGDAQHFINQCKLRMLEPENLSNTDFADERLLDYYVTIYTAYEDYLRMNGALDFEDLILRPVMAWRRDPALLEAHSGRFRHLLVDEYQDTNPVQFELVRLMAGGHTRLMVVGDEDQSIYSWRGADIKNLLEFEKHFPGAVVVRLEQNYRSAGNILRAASTVIANNTERLGKTLFTTLPPGPPLYAYAGQREFDEALTVALAIRDLVDRAGYRFGEIAIFYRIAALSRVFEDALRQMSVPHRVVGGMRFYDRAEVKDLLAYLQLAANPHNSLALSRVINVPKRGVGAKTIDLHQQVASQHRLSAYSAMRHPDFLQGISAKAANSLRDLGGLIDNLHAKAAGGAPPSQILQEIVGVTGYIQALGDPAGMEVRSRTENIGELMSAVVMFEEENPGATVDAYLERVTLASAADEAGGTSQVSLMTLHTAKGLEFRAVFLVGLEEGIFPSPRAVMEEGRMEEERRLFYVGITRARELLVLTRSASRVLYGEVRYSGPSVLFKELPTDLVEKLSLPSMDYAGLRDISGIAEYSQEEAGEMPAPRRAASSPAQPPARGGKYRLGDKVRHAILGEGIITGMNGSGNDASILVELDGGDTHQLLLRYAKLEVVERQ